MPRPIDVCVYVRLRVQPLKRASISASSVVAVVAAVVVVAIFQPLTTNFLFPNVRFLRPSYYTTI